MLIRVFLHAEFIFAMKTVPNPTIFVKNAKKKKKNRKMISFGNFCYFFEIFTETLEQNIRKSNKKCFQMEKKTNKGKLEIFKFLRDLVLSQGYSL